MPVRSARSFVGTVALLGLVWLTGCGGGGSSGGAAAPHFVDETASSGVEQQYTGEFAHFVGGGVAAFDCNGDGLDELYFAGGDSPAGLFVNESARGGALRFTRLASPVTDLLDVTGAYPIDIEGDGNADLVVLRRHGNAVLRGSGDCTFQDVTDSYGIDRGDAWTVGFSATWEADDALPTLAFGNYLVPDDDDCDDSQLIRPAAEGGTYLSPIALTPGYCTLSILFSDWGRTGQRDLRMANDRHYYLDGEEQLWDVAPGTAPRLYTEADGWKSVQIWGMGIASQDLTGDGRPEVVITSQGDNKMQTLDEGATGPSYHDIAIDRGTTAAQPFTGGDVLPSTAWHPEFEDVNNDGLFDLLITKGNVEAQVDSAMRDPSNLFLGRSDGTFVEGAEQAGVVSFERARGAALVDLNLDGMLDMVVVNRQANVSIRRNVGSGTADAPKPQGHWLGVRLQQPGGNVDAIGAWLDVRVNGRVVSREITIGGGHASGKLGWIHVGLGAASNVDVRVQWPDGEFGPWMPVDADRFVTLARGATAPLPWAPGS